MDLLKDPVLPLTEVSTQMEETGNEEIQPEGLTIPHYGNCFPPNYCCPLPQHAQVETEDPLFVEFRR